MADSDDHLLAGSQIDFFKEHGYLILEDALSADEVRQLRDASERLQEQRERDGGAENLVAIMNINLFDDAFNQTARHPAIIGAARSLLGDNLRLQHSKLNWKPPAKGRGMVDWHQDFPAFPHSNLDLVACMVLLDDATVDNGCMRVIPGSHKLGPLKHEEDGKFVLRCTDPTQYDETGAVDFVVPAGTVTIHHCLTVHSSYANNSDQPRRGLVYQIAAGDARQLGGKLHKVQSTWLHGADPLAARLEGGPTFRLPAPLTNAGGLEPSIDWQSIARE